MIESQLPPRGRSRHIIPAGPSSDIVAQEDYPIRPEHIDVSVMIGACLGKTETEAEARVIILFCQEQGHWGPINARDLASYRAMNSALFSSDVPDFFPEHLVSRSLLDTAGSHFRVTHRLISAVFCSNPARSFAPQPVG